MTNYADESAARRASEGMSVRVVSSPTDPMPNARRWVRERYGDDRHCRLITYGGTFFEWDGACWLEVEPEAVNAELYRYFEHAVYGTDQPSRFKPNSTKIANLVGSVRAVTHISRDHVVPSWLDGRTKPPATDIIPVANGILHVPSRKIYATTPALLVMHATPFAYDPSAPMPEGWLKFLKEIFPDDPESIMALQEWFGYLLSGDTSQQKILLIIGPKRSGKGTILRILKAIMGARHVAAPTLTSMSSNFGLQPLIGKPLALISDARIYGSHSVVVERLLSISGEDAITIDRKNREAWTGTLPTRIVIATNELPRLSDASGALASRMIILNTPESFYGRENHDLTDYLMEELPGIFNRALDGLDRLRRTGSCRYLSRGWLCALRWRRSRLSGEGVCQ